jgi:hypothetical protein
LIAIALSLSLRFAELALWAGVVDVVPE